MAEAKHTPGQIGDLSVSHNWVEYRQERDRLREENRELIDIVSEIANWECECICPDVANSPKCVVCRAKATLARYERSNTDNLVDRQRYNRNGE